MNFQLSLTLLSFNFVKIKNGLQTYQNASFKGTQTFPPPPSPPKKCMVKLLLEFPKRQYPAD